MARSRARSRLWAALALSAFLGAGSRELRAAADPDLDAEEPAAAPVMLDGATLFRLRGAATLPAQERARRIMERLSATGGDDTLDPGAVRIAESDVGSEIHAG